VETKKNDNIYNILGMKEVAVIRWN